MRLVRRSTRRQLNRKKIGRNSSELSSNKVQRSHIKLYTFSTYYLYTESWPYRCFACGIPCKVLKVMLREIPVLCKRFLRQVPIRKSLIDNRVRLKNCK